MNRLVTAVVVYFLLGVVCASVVWLVVDMTDNLFGDDGWGAILCMIVGMVISKVLWD